MLGNFSRGVVSSSKQEIKEYLLSAREKNLGFRLIYRPNLDISNRAFLETEIDWLCLLSRAVAPCDLIMDELDAFCDGSTMPAQLDVLVRYGRNIGISLHGAVRRPKVVIPRHYMTETTCFSVFRTIDPLDLAYISQFTGIPSEQISELAPMECLLWEEGLIRRIGLTYSENENTLNFVDYKNGTAESLE